MPHVINPVSLPSFYYSQDVPFIRDSS